MRIEAHTMVILVGVLYQPVCGIAQAGVADGLNAQDLDTNTEQQHPQIRFQSQYTPCRTLDQYTSRSGVHYTQEYTTSSVEQYTHSGAAAHQDRQIWQ
jgi:hypothetical protein